MDSHGGYHIFKGVTCLVYVIFFFFTSDKMTKAKYENCNYISRYPLV